MKGRGWAKLKLGKVNIYGGGGVVSEIGAEGSWVRRENLNWGMKEEKGAELR